MDLGAPTALASYAYLQAGGGGAGVLAALKAVTTSGNDVAGLVQSAGATEAQNGVQSSQGLALAAGTFELQASQGLASEALDNLLNPPLGFANPFINAQGVTDPSQAQAYAAYLYNQAQAQGQTALLTTALLKSAQASTQTATTQLQATPPKPAEVAKATTPAAGSARSAAGFDPMDTNRDGIVSPAESQAYGLSHPGLDPRDANYDGFVSSVEELAYAQQHAFLDPADTNYDGYVSPGETRAYALRHPTYGAPPAGAAGLDVYA